MISENATRGGTLVASLRSEPRTFNRVLDQTFPVDLFNILTSSKLIRVNRATRALEPALVEKWATSPDNLTYTLTLRDGVAWSDGTPFTSADVLFTFQAIYDPKVPSVLASGLRVNGQPLKVTAPDAKTVVVTLPGHVRSGHCHPRQRPRPSRNTNCRPRSTAARSPRPSASRRRRPISSASVPSC